MIEREGFWTITSFQRSENVGLRDLTALTLQTYFSKLTTSATNQTLSHESRDKIRDVLSSALRFAVQHDLLVRNPAESLRIPQVCSIRRQCCLPMTENPEASVLTARRAAQHFRLFRASDAYEHLCILSLLPSLAPLHLMLADTPWPRGFGATLTGSEQESVNHAVFMRVSGSSSFGLY